MASSKKKTTFTKLARETKLRERRLDKQAKKDARKRASDDQPAPLDDAVAARLESPSVGQRSPVTE